MKRLFLAVLVLGVAGAVYAKEGKGKKMIEHMKAQLELTDDQAAKIEKSMEASKESSKPLRRQMRDLTAKLEDQLEDKAGDADLKATLDSIEKVHKDLQAQMERSHDSMKAILTVKQRAKMVVGMKHHKGMMGHGGKRPGMKGEHGPKKGAKPDKDAPADEDDQPGDDEQDD